MEPPRSRKATGAFNLFRAAPVTCMSAVAQIAGGFGMTMPGRVGVARWTGAIGLAVMVAVVPRAAERPSFAGTWKIDVPQSTPTAGGGRYFTQDAALSDVTLVITQTEGELVIDRQVGDRAGRTVLRLDGVESEVEGPRGGRYTAKSRWDGARIVTEGTQVRQGPNGEVEVHVTDVRELSPDGKTMTITTTIKAPRGANVRKLVFVRQG